MVYDVNNATIIIHNEVVKRSCDTCKYQNLQYEYPCTMCFEPELDEWECTEDVEILMQKGEWVLKHDDKHDVDYYVCSECGWEPWNKLYLTRYCPNCGKEMNVEW